MNKREKFNYANAVIPQVQKEPFDCGSTSLSMAYAAFGLTIPTEQVTEEMKLTEEGASWQQMRQHAGDKGFDIQFQQYGDYGMLLRTFEFTKCPIIIGWWTDRNGEPDAHFSVITDMDKYGVTLADPSFGDTIRYPRAVFESKWRDCEGERTFMAMVPRLDL